MMSTPIQITTDLVQILERIEQKIDRNDERLTEKVEALDQRLTEKIEALDERLSEKIEALDEHLTQKIDKSDERLTKLEVGQARLEEKFNSIEKLVSLLREDIKEIEGTQKAQIWVLITILAIAVLGVLIAGSKIIFLNGFKTIHTTMILYLARFAKVAAVGLKQLHDLIYVQNEILFYRTNAHKLRE